MSDEQPDDEERISLIALLNRRVPANPGKPRPWVPSSDSARYATQGETTAANADDAEEGFGEARPSEPPRPATVASESGAVAPPADRQGSGDRDLSALLADVNRLASLMRGQLTEIQGAIESAKEQIYEATTADEAVRVTVDGRPRVTRVSVGPKAIRGGPEALGAWIVEAVNTATSQARAGAQSAVVDGLDPEMRAVLAAEIAKVTANVTSDEGAGAVPPRGDGHA